MHTDGDKNTELSTSFGQEGVVIEQVAGAIALVWMSAHKKSPCRRNRGRFDSQEPFLLQQQGLEDSQKLLPPGALSRMEAHRPSWVGTPYGRPGGSCAIPERPTGLKPTLCSRNGHDGEDAAYDSYMNSWLLVFDSLAREGGLGNPRCSDFLISRPMD